VEELKKEIVFNPAYDRRNPDPTKNFGIGSVLCSMILSGNEGAVVFNFSTGMLLPSTIKEYIETGKACYKINSDGMVYFLNIPCALDIACHSKKPLDDDHSILNKTCDYIGQPCYYESSSIEADEYLQILIEKGSEPIWDLLTSYYNETFNKNKSGVKNE